MSKRMVFLVFTLVSLSVFMAFRVFADELPALESGRYTVAGSFPADLDVTKVCAFRKDTNVDLKCVTVGLNQTVAADGKSATVTAADGRRYKVTPPSPTGKVALIQDVDLTNTGVDVKIGLRAEDTGGNESVSDNVTVVDFTAPSKPVLISVTPN